MGNAQRAHSLRELINRTGYLARAPEAGEYEAMAAGIRALARGAPADADEPHAVDALVLGAAPGFAGRFAYRSARVSFFARRRARRARITLVSNGSRLATF